MSEHGCSGRGGANDPALNFYSNWRKKSKEMPGGVVKYKESTGIRTFRYGSRSVQAMKNPEIRPFQKSRVPAPNGPLRFEKPEARALCIEIGCGTGYHSIQFSQNNPDSYLVAIERTREKFQKFWRRYLNHAQPGNLRPVHEDAVSWITHFVGLEWVDEYFILYPNPYPKKSQANKRWVYMPFMKQLLMTLKKQGRITLATNERYYFEESLEGFQKIWGLDVIEASEIDPQASGRTHFERKYLKRGERCYNLILQKASAR